jgi:hypothetical protein
MNFERRQMFETKFLSGNLYSVPFSMIQIPVEKDEFSFTNPRTLTEKGKNDFIDKKSFASLKKSISKIGLLNPFICRWIKDEDGKEFPQLIGGDRRYRVLKSLIENKEIVVDPQTRQESPANLVYENVTCQIYPVGNDLEAYLLSWWENKDRIDLTEGHEIAQVMQLRKYERSDEEIISVLQKDEKWLRESDNLIANLGESLEDLIENRITRDCALALCRIDDLDRRKAIKEQAFVLSKEKYENKIEKIQKEIDRQNDVQNIAEGRAVVARYKNDEEAKAEAEALAKEAKEMKEEKEKDILNLENKVSAKELAAAAKILNPNGPPPDRQVCLKYLKIKDGLDYFDKILNERQFPDFDLSESDLKAIKLASMILKDNILSNDSNWEGTLQNFLAN